MRSKLFDNGCFCSTASYIGLVVVGFHFLNFDKKFLSYRYRSLIVAG